MTVAPLIAMKSSQVKSFDAVGRELDRRAHTYANDVDQSGRHIGYRCRAEDERPVPLEKAVERRMGELKTKRKVRDNQVRAMGFIVSSNDALDEKTAREFLDRSINWFGARYGYENLLAAQIHLDEGTPHAHIWIAPVIHDRETGFDRLCAKELFAPDKRRKNAAGKWEVTAQGTMSRLQEDFWEQVAKPYGYERPLRHELRAKGYRSLDAYKVQVGTTRALKSEIETLEGARDKAKHSAVTAKRELDSAIEDKRFELQDLGEQIRRETQRLESVRRAVEEKRMEPAPQTVAESARTLWPARNDGAREEVLAGEISGLRSRISELEGANQRARERVAELDRELPGLRGRYQQLERRFGDVAGRVRQAIERLREVPETVSAWALDIAHKLGKRTYDPCSLDYMVREATRAAEVTNAARGWEPRQNRNWSR